MPTLAHRLEEFRRDRSRRAHDMRKLAAGWGRMASAGRSAQTHVEEMSIARLLALAYPERIGKARDAPGQFLLANGRGANLDPTHPLARSPFLVAAELSGSAASTRILLAAAADEADVLAAAGKRIRETDETEFDVGAAALRSRRVRRLEAIVMAAAPRAVEANGETARLLAEGIAKLGASRLPWSKAQRQLRDRVGFLRAAGGGAKGNEWPDLTDAALARTAAEWLAPFLAGKTKLAEIGADDLAAALDALLPWNLKRRLDEDGADALRGAHGPSSRHRLRGGGGARPAHPRAGAVRAHPAPFDRQRQAAAYPQSALAGPPADSDHARPAGLLEGIVGGGQSRDERPLPAPPLARRSRAGRSDRADQAARDVTG